MDPVQHLSAYPAERGGHLAREHGLRARKRPSAGRGNLQTDLLLAATRHIVVLASAVCVLAFTAIDLVVSPMPVFEDEIVAIPTVDDISAIIAGQVKVVARPAVDNVVARPLARACL